MFCPDCGVFIEEEVARYCPECGEKLNWEIGIIENRIKKDYPGEIVIKILESFRILLKIRDLSEKKSYAWEYQEQFSLLKKYLDFNPNFLLELENEIKKINVSVSPDSKVPDFFRDRIRRIVNNTIDVWISEFLKHGFGNSNFHVHFQET